MRNMPFFRHISLCLFGALACLAPLAFAEAVSPQEQVQIQASRATSSLMLLRGEGFQKKHQDTLDTDLQTLAGAGQKPPPRSEAPRRGPPELAVQGPRGRKSAARGRRGRGTGRGKCDERTAWCAFRGCSLLFF